MTPSRRGMFGRVVTSLCLALGVPVVAATAAVADGPTTFGNTAAMDIPAAGSPNQIGDASPYPSPITVSGMTGTVSNITVTFNNLTHSIANDIDALLVSPTGENLMVMSDASKHQHLHRRQQCDDDV